MNTLSVFNDGKCIGYVNIDYSCPDWSADSSRGLFLFLQYDFRFLETDGAADDWEE